MGRHDSTVPCGAQQPSARAFGQQRWTPISRALVSHCRQVGNRYSFVPFADLLQIARGCHEWTDLVSEGEQEDTTLLQFLRETRHDDRRPRFEENHRLEFRATQSSRTFRGGASPHASGLSTFFTEDMVSTKITSFLRHENNREWTPLQRVFDVVRAEEAFVIEVIRKSKRQNGRNRFEI